MRLLGVDFGGKKIGIAVCEIETGLPRPIQGLVATGTLAKDAAAINQLAKEHGVSRVILGLPLDNVGETKMSRIVRMLGDKLIARGVEVEYENESMTSFIAETRMKESGMKGSEIRRKVDAEAACQILERYLERNAESQ